MLRSLIRRPVARAVSALVVSLAVAGRIWAAWTGRGRAGGERDLLPSLYDEHPSATAAPRRRIGLKTVPIDRIVGTMRRPSQNTADFRPLPRLRGRNWRARWQRINRAMDRLETLPAIDLAQVGDDYYVADGHNRVAAARRAGAVDIDADVTQLVLPGVTLPGQATLDTTSLIGAAEVRQAAAGRQARTVERRDAFDEVSRQDLIGADDEPE